eukprot:1103802-Prymnesium_polylepis.1
MLLIALHRRLWLLSSVRLLARHLPPRPRSASRSCDAVRPLRVYRAARASLALAIRRAACIRR